MEDRRKIIPAGKYEQLVASGNLEFVKFWVSYMIEYNKDMNENSQYVKYVCIAYAYGRWEIVNFLFEKCENPVLLKQNIANKGFTEFSCELDDKKLDEMQYKHFL